MTTRKSASESQAYIVGLTGNIATGKTKVARLLASLGAHVIDADQVSREVMRSGTATWRDIVARFGDGILAADGEINRRALGDIVFADPSALSSLESIVHPAVLDEIDDRIAEIARESIQAPIIVVEAIKLVESGMHAQYDTLWVVTCTAEVQLARLLARSGLSEEGARLRIDAQPSADPKIALADVVIDNKGAWKETERQVRLAWEGVRAAALDKSP